MSVISVESPQAAPAEYPRYDVVDYQPDGGCSTAGVGMLISALVIVGGLLGFVAHLVSQAFYLIIIFPAFIGVALGFIGRKMVVSGRVRNPIVGGIAGFLGGILAMTMMHYFDYEQFKGEVAKLSPNTRQVVEVLAQVPVERRKDVLKEDITDEQMASLNKLVEAASIHSFIDYMNFEAREGVEISSTHSLGNDRGLNLGFYGSYIYWLIEILIVAAITFGIVKTAASQPFCASCSEWMKLKAVGFFGAPLAPPVVAAIRSGDLGQIVAQVPTQTVTNLKLSAATCPHCGNQGGTDLKLEHVTRDKKGNLQFKTIAHSSYPGQAMEALSAMFLPKPIAPAVPAPAAGEGAASASATG
jgi:hypothetical protein